MSLRNKAVIVGVGESDIGKMPHMTGLGLNAQAAKRAIDDAGLKVSDIDGLLTAYSFTEPYFMLGTVMAEYLGLKPRFCASMSVGGASPAAMLHHAAMAVAQGQCNTVLVCAGENRATGMTRDEAVAALAAVGHPYFEAPYGASIPALYALIAQRYMHEFGLSREALASVAVMARRHAGLHPNAHMRKPITAADVLNAKPIAEPLTMLDCCLISDAGGAFIVTSPERARDRPCKPAYLLGIGECHTHEHLLCADSLTRFGAVESGRAAYAMAGLGPKDMDLAQLYDCFTIVPIIELEELGFCAKGEGGRLIDEGVTEIGGALPVNTSGGLQARGEPLGASHYGQIYEIVTQLRGGAGSRQVEGATVGLAQVFGAWGHCGVTILKRAL